MLNKIAAPAALITLLLAACAPGEIASARSDVPRITSPQVDPDQLDELAKGNMSFALNFYQQIATSKDGNVVFSPYSIYSALAMLYAGARGDTESQMADALHYTLFQDALHPAFNQLDLSLDEANGEGFQLNVTNAAWGQPGFGFEQTYLDTLASHYGAGLNLVDFATDPESARQTINQWVEDETEDKIVDLLPPGSVTDLARLVLTNAIYLKAKWLNPFDAGSTADAPFTLLDGSTVTVQMMNKRTSYQVASGDGWRAIAVPYEGERMAMVIVVPDAGTFAQFEAGLDAAPMNSIIESVQASQPADVDLRMPRFDFGTDVDMKESLAALGITDAFDPALADFSGIDGPASELFVQGAFHKATITVDEEGTEAAAASALVIGVESMPMQFNVDRPFLFTLVDNETDTLLFLGRVLNPVAG